MGVFISTKFSSPEEFEAWLEAQEHSNKDFLDNICEQDKQRWDTKACKMTVKDGKLQLLCEQGNVLAETDYYQPDGDTVCCDGKDGKLSIKGIQNANDPNGKKYRVWVGTQEEYNAIRVKDPKTMYYITDETLLDDILSGAIKVGHAKKADNATKADSATKAKYDDEGYDIGESYLKRWGGIMTGRLYFWNNDALSEIEEGESPELFLGVTSFENMSEDGLRGGRQVKAQKPENVKVGHSTEAETAIKLSDGWTYEGEWNGLGGKTLGWNDYHGMYVIKLVDIGAVNKHTYSFVITPDSANQYGDTDSNCVYYNGNGHAGLLSLRTRYTDIIAMHITSWELQEGFSTSSTFKVYWKKIF